MRNCSQPPVFVSATGLCGRIARLEEQPWSKLTSATTRIARLEAELRSLSQQSEAAKLQAILF